MKIRDGTNQPATMTVKTYPDQHRRPWDVTLDRDTLSHLGLAIPRFRAPLNPQPYFRTDPEQLGRGWVDYEAWEQELEAAEREWQRRRLEIGRSEKDEDVIAQLMGPMPEAVEFVRAARAGNKWVLGIPHPDPTKRYTCPEALRPLLDRIGPRLTTPADLAARARLDRAQYADAEEEVPETTADADDPILSGDDEDAEDFDAPGGYGDEFDDEAALAAHAPVAVAPPRRQHRRTRPPTEG